MQFNAAYIYIFHYNMYSLKVGFLNIVFVIQI